LTAVSGQRRRRSLRFRLLAATVLAMLLALVLSGFLLSGLFRDHVVRQFSRSLTAQLDHVTARLEFDAAGQPQLDPQLLSDPRWSRPYSGLYWQVDRADGTPLNGVLRSRSLWDATLKPAADALADGEVHMHEVAGPQGARLMLVERTVAHDGTTPASWRLMVAADMGETTEAVSRFTGVLATSLVILLGLLSAAALAQVAVGLAPLRALQRALVAVHEGRSQRLDDPFPAEVQPLVDDFNRVLDRNAEIVTRARTQAGNLAHAIKTPLAAMSQAAASAMRSTQAATDLAALVDEQVRVAGRHIDWHLARSRAAAAHGIPGARAAVQPAIGGLIRLMERVHAERGLRIQCDSIASDLTFAGEVQDLQEVVGNLIDNACKWARNSVHVVAWSESRPDGRRLRIAVEDDGPGIAAERRESVMARGARLDESVPGSGLGLGIVRELVSLYGGNVSLASASSGGLRVELELPGG
jgi:signal transduction histidine kinase